MLDRSFERIMDPFLRGPLGGVRGNRVDLLNLDLSGTSVGLVGHSSPSSFWPSCWCSPMRFFPRERKFVALTGLSISGMASRLVALYGSMVRTAPPSRAASARDGADRFPVADVAGGSDLFRAGRGRLHP